MQGLLEKLGIESVNPGGYCGEWIGGGEKLDSISPIDGKVIASVNQVAPNEYEKISVRAHEAFLKWRTVPAPVRGEMVRQFGVALRTHRTSRPGTAGGVAARCQEARDGNRKGCEGGDRPLHRGLLPMGFARVAGVVVPVPRSTAAVVGL